MGTTYILLASQSIANNTTTTFTFSGIPNSYTDLHVLANIKGFTTSGDTNTPMNMRINGLTSSVYYAQGITWYNSAKIDRTLSGDTSVVMSNAIPTNQADSSIRSLHRLYYPRYSETNESRKIGWWDSSTMWNSNTASFSSHRSWIYDSANSTAISSITFFVTSTNTWFGSGSRFYLYGIDRNA